MTRNWTTAATIATAKTAAVVVRAHAAVVALAVVTLITKQGHVRA